MFKQGANTLTRSLIQFGQGLMRAHPHLLSVVRSVQKGDDLKGFNDGMAAMVMHGASNRCSLHIIHRDT